MKETVKSHEEKELDKARQEYFDRFGSHYVFDFGGPYMTTEETIEEIRHLIATGKKQTIHRHDKDIIV